MPTKHWQSFTWTLKGPYTFHRTDSPNVVRVTGAVGYVWWKKRVEGHLRLSLENRGWFWVESGVELRLAPQFVFSSMFAALETDATSELDQG